MPRRGHRSQPSPDDPALAPQGGPLSLFISYRRTDSAGHVGRLYDRFMAIPSFRAGGIFRDIDSIQIGADFVAAMNAAVGFADVVVAVMGTEWTSVANAHGRRLEDRTDAVRLELIQALTSGVPIVPVLVRDAHMPRPDELPAPLVPLVTLNGIEVSDARFDHDVERLVHAIQKAVAASKHSRPARPDKPAAGPYYEMGNAYLQQSDFVNAKRCMQAAVTAQPDSTDALLGLASALQGEAQSHLVAMNYGLARDRLAEGEAAVMRALQRDDTNPDVHGQLGFLRKEIVQSYDVVRNRRAQSEARAHARASFEMALSLAPQDTSALNGLANLADMEGDHDRAIELGTQILRLDPTYSYALFDLATAYEARARRSKGERRRDDARRLLRICQRLVALEEDDSAMALQDDMRTDVRRMIAWAEETVAVRRARPRRRR